MTYPTLPSEMSREEFKSYLATGRFGDVGGCIIDLMLWSQNERERLSPSPTPPKDTQ